MGLIVSNLLLQNEFNPIQNGFTCEVERAGPIEFWIIFQL